MSSEFEQISLKPGFMKHNGGLLFKTISENEYEFKTKLRIALNTRCNFYPSLIQRVAKFILESPLAISRYRKTL